jgi:hypothetical protein
MLLLLKMVSVPALAAVNHSRVVWRLVWNAAGVLISHMSFR